MKDYIVVSIEVDQFLELETKYAIEAGIQDVVAGIFLEQGINKYSRSFRAEDVKRDCEYIMSDKYLSEDE